MKNRERVETLQSEILLLPFVRLSASNTCCMDKIPYLSYSRGRDLMACYPQNQLPK